jgi:L-ascorbate metabolism protein UlaG (beta-lactamase superfamily)
MKKLTKLEHAGLIIENGAMRIALDPGSLTGPVSRKSLSGVDAVLVTHKHGDHFNIPVLKEIGAPVYGPAEVVALAITAGLPGKALSLGQEMEVAGAKVVAVPANHGPAVTTPVQNYGFVVEVGGSRIYVTSDMAGPQDGVPSGPFAVVAVPIEGGGFVFGAEEAADFVRGLGHTGLVVGLHADEAPAMREEFYAFAKAFSKPMVPKPGESVEF